MSLSISLIVVGKKPQTPTTQEGKEGKEKDQLLKDLQTQIPVLKEQLDKEMKDRNYFQLESVCSFSPPPPFFPFYFVAFSFFLFSCCLFRFALFAFSRFRFSAFSPMDCTNAVKPG